MKSSPKKWLILSIVSTALFLITIDMAVLYTALPALTRDLGLTPSEKLWVSNIYPLFIAGLLPGLGVLGDRIGHRKTFIMGQIVFGLSSLGAAFAPSGSILILARMFLAIGGALMMPPTLSLIRLTFTDPKERSFAFGIWSAIASAGAALGPVVGGIMVEYFWWGAVFLINVPIIIVALPMALAFIRETTVNKSRKWDVKGALQIMVALLCIVYSIKGISSQNTEYYVIAATALTGIIFMYIFIKRQHRLDEPLIDFSLFKQKIFTIGVSTAFLASVALVGSELLITQRLQLILNLTPTQAGMFIMPVPVCAFIAGPIAGMLISRWGIVNVIFFGLSLTSIGLGLCIALMNMSYIWQLLALALLGFGCGSAVPAASNATMLSASSENSGMAASINEVAFELGGAMGIAILGGLMNLIYTLSFSLPNYTAGRAKNSIDEAIMLAKSLPGEYGVKMLQAAHTAFNNSYVIALGFASGLMLLTAIFIYTRIKR